MGPRRLFPRIHKTIPVTFSVDGTPVVGFTENLSRRGMLVKAERVPRAGELLDLRIQMPSGRETVLDVRVTYAGDDAFGAELTSDNEDYAAFLGLLVSAGLRKKPVEA